MTICDLRIRYGQLPAIVDGVNLTLDRGECLLLTGPSGCGKTTLARAVAGLIPHAIPASVEGEVRLDGVSIQGSTLPAIARRVGMVFQNPASQLFHLDVESEVSFGPHNLGLPLQEIEKRVEWALDIVGMTEFRRHSPAELSGGQQQRLAIAAVLAMQPDILVLDEPTSSLDTEGVRDIVKTLCWLRKHLNLSILLLEHRLVDVATLADKLAIMDQGKIVKIATTSEIFSDTALCNRYGLRIPNQANTVKIRTVVSPYEPEASEKLSAVFTSLRVSEMAGQSEPSLLQIIPQAKPLLVMQGVTAGYGRQSILHDIDLTIAQDDFVGILGHNGAGKTTLALVMAGLLQPRKGKVYFANGHNPRAGEDVSLLFQNPTDQLFTDSVAEEVAFGSLNFGHYNAAEQERLLTDMGLWPLRKRMPTALSIGQQQRTALCACMALRTRLLILDEPTIGQDWTHLLAIMKSVKQLHNAGTAVILITHDIELIDIYANRRIELKHGRIYSDEPIIGENCCI